MSPLMQRFLAMVLAATALVVGARGEELPGEHSVLPAPPQAEPSNPPPGVIPWRDPASWRAGRIYFAENSTYDLPAGMFWVFLPDFPKAILFKVRATPLGFDEEFYYFRDAMFDHEWAFGRQPADDFFAAHAIWSRPSGQTAWDLRTSDGQMASPAPMLPAPREQSVVTMQTREPARVSNQARNSAGAGNQARRRSQASNQSPNRNRSTQRNDPPERDGLLFGRSRRSDRGRN